MTRIWTPLRIGATVLLLAALVLVQILVLDRRPEKIEEDRLTRVSEMPVRSAIPSYLASLFLGPMRPVMVDVFWIQLRDLRSARRYFEAKQLMELISWLQPRNPEVWSILGHDAMYNIPLGASLDAEAQWNWIRYGILKLHEGAVSNPGNPYLKYELAYRTMHRTHLSRPAWHDVDLIHRIERDDEIQQKLQETPHPNERLSPYRLARIWFRKAREQIESLPARDRFSFFITQMGLYLHPDYMESSVRECAYREGMVRWQKGDAEGAKTAFREAAAISRAMLKKYGVYRQGINRILSKFYDRLPRAVDLAKKLADHDTPDEEKRLLHRVLVKHLETTMKSTGSSCDEGYVLQALSRLKQILIQESQGRQDPREFDDGEGFSNLLVERVPASSNIAPDLRDTDWHRIEIPFPAADEHGPPSAFVPRTISLEFVNEGRIDLLLRIKGKAAMPLVAGEIPAGKKGGFSFVAGEPGFYHLSIEAASPSAAPAPASGYTLQWTRTEPPLEKPGRPHGHSH